MLWTAGRLWGNACGRVDERGTIIGAIGVSGALSSQDAQVASACPLPSRTMKQVSVSSRHRRSLNRNEITGPSRHRDQLQHEAAGGALDLRQIRKANVHASVEQHREKSDRAGEPVDLRHDDRDLAHSRSRQGLPQCGALAVAARLLALSSRPALSLIAPRQRSPPPKAWEELGGFHAGARLTAMARQKGADANAEAASGLPRPFGTCSPGSDCSVVIAVRV